MKILGKKSSINAVPKAEINLPESAQPSAIPHIISKLATVKFNKIGVRVQRNGMISKVFIKIIPITEETKIQPRINAKQATVADKINET